MGDEHDVRPSMQSMAREFPGALDELDWLPLEEIEGRLSAIEGSLARGRAERWMEWMAAYHESMRAALYLARHRGERDEASLAKEAERVAGVRCDVEFVRQVTGTKRGHLSEIVVQRLAILSDASPEIVARALLPERRAR